MHSKHWFYRLLGKAAGVFIPAAFFCTHAAFAETPAKPVTRQADHGKIFTIALENDLFGGEDRHYTNGVRAAFLSAENNIPDWLENTANTLPFFATEGYKRWHFALGQSMFTPANTSRPELQVTERPYAGWTYGSIGMLSD